MTLYDVSGCAGRFLPWAGRMTRSPRLPAYGDALVIPVQVDGRPLRALPDTGRHASLVGAGHGASRLVAQRSATAPGCPSTASAPSPAPRIRTGSPRCASAIIRSTNPELLAVPVHLYPIVDMLLGLDWLRGRRLWLLLCNGADVCG